jgi:hypothetical protein
MESFWDMGVAGGGYLAGSLGGNLPYTTIFLLLAAINLPAVAGVHFMKEKRG